MFQIFLCQVLEPGWDCWDAAGWWEASVAQFSVCCGGWTAARAAHSHVQRRRKIIIKKKQLFSKLEPWTRSDLCSSSLFYWVLRRVISFSNYSWSHQDMFCNLKQACSVLVPPLLNIALFCLDRRNCSTSACSEEGEEILLLACCIAGCQAQMLTRLWQKRVTLQGFVGQPREPTWTSGQSQRQRQKLPPWDTFVFWRG